MALIVQKYGGSSVGNLDRIHHVAEKVIKAKLEGHHVIVVVSAMYGETDRLIGLANALTQNHDPREYDVLISSGEQVSMALLSMALNAKNCPARSFTGPQIGIYTDSIHTKARILEVKTDIIQRELQQGRIVIVAGFQGVNEYGDITTLGRGGSDTTAVAIAAAVKADECQIYTDVDGVYTTDPHMLPEARLIPQISFEEMLEMSSLGAKVLQMRSVELASKHNMPIRVLSTFSDGSGTLVTFEDKIMHKRLVSGIAFSREEAIISLSGIPRRIGVEGLILGKVSQANIEIDMIAQNASLEGKSDFTFTVQRREYPKALKIIEELAAELGAVTVKTNSKVAKLSLVGIGMRSHTGVASTMFKALGTEGINIQMITTSEIKISVVLDEDHLEKGVRAVHQAFELDKPHQTVEQSFFE
ncbi:Aspartate kinase [Aquicella siphonis]|uniref:Aspartokinase n=1 Tax=Aquicella siphonis TaxID=254247 RepID=A0A5E4PI69_9COXI|nr:aspartate kinase [Aquicella siphonis]VVC76255.1 Aspartate kinase [Aquicella siphonis]